jgi:hypothetical protein
MMVEKKWALMGHLSNLKIGNAVTFQVRAGVEPVTPNCYFIAVTSLVGMLSGQM